MSIQSARAAAVRDAAGLLVYGSKARRRWWRTLRVPLHARQQDAAQCGLSGRMKQQLRWEAWKKGLKVYFRITISNIQLLFTAKVNLEKPIRRRTSLDCSAIQTQQEHAHSTQKSPWPSGAFIQWGDSAKCCSSDISKILTSLQDQQPTFQDAEAWNFYNFLSWQKNTVRLWLFNTFTLIQSNKSKTLSQNTKTLELVTAGKQCLMFPSSFFFSFLFKSFE